MATQVIMPQLGESVVEGTITRWLKTAGDTIQEFEPLVEINTDKVDTEIASPATGKLLTILVPEGTTVHAGTLLAWIGEKDEAIPLKETASIAAAQATPTPPVTVREVAAVEPDRRMEGEMERRDLGFISPVVSRIAQEYRVDLASVKGTGQGGRITKKDVLAYVEERSKATPTQTPIVEMEVTSLGEKIMPLEKPTEKIPTPITGEVIPLSPVRRAIADHMVLSKHTSPHVTTVMEADLSRVVSHREANKAAYLRDGISLTYTAYFASAAIAALKAFPLVNSSWSEAGIVLHRQINIGLAASMGEEGLIVPVIKNADGFSLLGLARTINDLANRARAKKLLPEEVKGGTFTITNHGVTGSLFATPIINQPQCGILGVGLIQKRVMVIEGNSNGVPDAIAIRPMVYLSLTFDHRILDGAIADNFLGKVVETLQNWG